MSTYLYKSSETKIGDLDDIGFSHKYISSCKIAMDVVLRLEVRHAGRDLCRHVDERLKLQAATFTCNNILYFKYT